MKASVVGYVGCLFCLACCALPVFGQQIYREGFEGPQLSWTKGTSDVPFRVLAHRLSNGNDEPVFSGKHSELVHVQAEQGNQLFFTFGTPKAPLSEELTVKLWVRPSRPGVTLLARLVLPKERNPGNLQEPLTVYLRSDPSQVVGKWQPLVLRNPTKLARAQQQLLQAQLGREISLSEAYIDQLLLNLATGPGELEIWLDDLEVGPVLEKNLFQPTSRENPKDSRIARPNLAGPDIRWDGEQFKVGGKKFFFRAIRYSDTRLDVLRKAGFNTVWLDENSDPGLAEKAIKEGFCVVPVLPIFTGTGGAALTSQEDLSRRMQRYLQPDGVLFWTLGSGGLSQEQSTGVAKLAELVRAQDARPVATDVLDGFEGYARNVNLLGVHRWPLMTSLELSKYRDWLSQRRLLAQRGTFMWTWIQTHLPEWYVQTVYEKQNADGFEEAVGPQPEQIRLLSYTALGSGCRGLGFWSDRYLADSHQGQDRLFQLALLNQEWQLLEPLLVNADAPTWLPTSVPEVKAALFRTEKGLLVLPIWLGSGSQFVVAQGAVPELSLVVPQVPNGALPYEVSAQAVLGVRWQRVPGGTKITLRDFDLTRAVVFTSDLSKDGLVVSLQEQSFKMRRQAAEWQFGLATRTFEKVTQIEQKLALVHQRVRNEEKLLQDAREALDQCKVCLQEKQRDGEALTHAQLALRPLRIIMREQWEAANRDLDVPVSSPYATSYYTLPKHWEFVSQLRNSVANRSVLAHGDFELPMEQTPEGWTIEQTPSLDQVSITARRVADDAYEGRQCLLLQIAPKNPSQPISILERTLIAINTPVVELPPGTLVQISAWIRIPAPLTGSVDGAMFYDNIGDAALGVRLTEANKWKQIRFYRRVPSSGKVYATLALSGIGSVYFDDVQIRPLSPK